MIMIAGAVLGAVVGLKMAQNLVKEMEVNQGRFPISGSDSIKAGLSAFSIMKQLTGGRG